MKKLKKTEKPKNKNVAKKSLQTKAEEKLAAKGFRNNIIAIFYDKEKAYRYFNRNRFEERASITDYFGRVAILKNS